MIPYLLLTAEQRARVRKVVEEHAFEDDTVEATLTLLKEVGDDSARLCLTLQQEERDGFMRAGTYTALIEIMRGSPRSDADWRTISRRRP